MDIADEITEVQTLEEDGKLSEAELEMSRIWKKIRQENLLNHPLIGQFAASTYGDILFKLGRYVESFDVFSAGIYDGGHDDNCQLWRGMAEAKMCLEELEEARKFVDDIVQQAQQDVVQSSDAKQDNKEPRVIEIISEDEPETEQSANVDSLKQQVESLQEELRRLQKHL